ncbi:MAG: helix-turn-helix transcriptional regulator [Hyphomonadaceae bacterium]|nr:MAG: marR [Caulobacteraceae bacterium]MBT9444963.1 helix-turn-helix transcriptional regulator [Hyphomonadaceae bacterium]
MAIHCIGATPQPRFIFVTRVADAGEPFEELRLRFGRLDSSSFPNITFFKKGNKVSGTRTSFSDHDCGFALAIEALGDQWCLLITRNLFMGMERYDDFAEHLPISTKVLAERLQRLVAHGLVSAAHSPKDRRGKIYQLTSKGRELQPFVGYLTQWGDKWVPKKGGRRTKFFDLKTGDPVVFGPINARTGRAITCANVGTRTGPGGSKVRASLEAIVARRNGEKATS